MNRSIKALALAAFALAAAFGATTAQASATNFNVKFNFKNMDPLPTSYSMIRTSTLPATVTGLPAAWSVPRLSFDPSSGNAVYSDALPGVGLYKQVSIDYSNASDGVSNRCSFTIKVSRDLNVSPYLLHFSTTSSSCIVPGDVRSSDGQFTSTAYELDWSS